MNTPALLGAVMACALLGSACGNDDSARPDPGGAKTAQPGPTAGVQQAPAPAKTDVPATPPPAAPQPKGYSRDAIKAIPDNCASPLAVLATAPASVGDKYAWPIARQALLANQQFRVTVGPPAVPGEVQLATHKYNDSYALVATCKDGGTCNDLAAMHKAIVRSSFPQVVCGKMNGLSASPVGAAFSWGAGPKQNLPTDVVGKCARLNACSIATDRSTAGDPFLECQKAPSNFKLDCAARYPCSEVLACAAR